VGEQNLLTLLLLPKAVPMEIKCLTSHSGGLAHNLTRLKILHYTKKGKAMNHKTIVAAFIFTAALSPSVQAIEVSKDAWIGSMTSILPTAFCNSSQYFRQCFTVTAQECEETASTATRVCISKNADKIPKILKQPEDGTHWGTIIGACAGEAYEIALIKKRIKNTRCDNPANWQ
jgi:hypothetical protein